MRICFIGDSFVNGTGDDECLGWAGRICAKARRSGCDITLYNLGIRGNTTADIADRWEHEAKARLGPDDDGRLVFSFGVNDCICGDSGRPRLSETASLSNARRILATASAWLPTLMIGPPPTDDTGLNDRVKQFADRLHHLCADLDVPYFSAWEPLITSNTWLREVRAGDGAHPNGGGYALLADLIAEWPPWCLWIDRLAERT